ncbi:MAG: hypothetical protein EON84_17095 [Bradyrhizobiaceae bacterium]|nr:MAG: hypothetical protein EON84_17095 [Bradyrhizobiaceae bacterium]
MAEFQCRGSIFNVLLRDGVATMAEFQCRGSIFNVLLRDGVARAVAKGVEKQKGRHVCRPFENVLSA